MDTLLLLVILAAIILSIALVGFVIVRKWRGGSASRISIHSRIEQIKSIGQLSVFKVITKEIVTETDHSWGEFGAKYLSWVLSKKKMAMILEFEIDFRYDLKRPEFQITETDGGSYLIKMPPAFYEAHIRDIQFYDEQNSRFLPWLLPDLLNGFLVGGFSEEHKNKLVAAAKAHAAQQARELIGSLESEVQASAVATLQSISRAFGVEDVSFDFTRQVEIELDIAYPKESVA